MEKINVYQPVLNNRQQIHSRLFPKNGKCNPAYTYLLRPLGSSVGLLRSVLLYHCLLQRQWDREGLIIGCVTHQIGQHWLP